jgi:ribulose-phosphate 3-epimerase
MITPAIIPRSLDHLKESLAKLPVENWQIDVVDGRFVPHRSWPYEPYGDVSDARDAISTIKAEIDLMVEEPIKAAAEWMAAGASALVFHLEGLLNPSEALELVEGSDVQIAFSITNDTPMETLYKYVDSLDFVQLMGIKSIGSQGQPFDERVLDRIIEMSSLFPHTPISVDGGVSFETITSLKEAGASRFVVGSVIQNAVDPFLEYQKLLKIIA